MEGISFTDCITGEGYGISKLPGRKRVALYETGKGCIRPIAYFHDEAAAQRFLEWLGKRLVQRIGGRDG